MKTSKGIVYTPKKYLTLADPEIYRMLILRTNPMKHISLRIEEIPQYNDYYEKMENIFYRVEESEPKEEIAFYKYIYPLIKVDDVPKDKPFRTSLKLLIFLSQMQNILSLDKLYEKALSTLGVGIDEKIFSINDFKVLLKRTENWIHEVKKILNKTLDPKIKRNIQNKIDIFTIPETIDTSIINKLNDIQINGLKLFKNYLLKHENLEADLIQNKIFSIAKQDLKLPPKKLFEALYQVILGNKSGPRLGPFIIMLDKDWLLKRISQID
jgi:lysyl-tRNA synthetase class 1